MLIQCFAQNKKNVMDAVNMLYLQFASQLTHIEFAIMSNVNRGYDNTVDWEIYNIVRFWPELNKEFNEELDNVGVYYNEGEKIFVRLYKNAKVDFEAYKHAEVNNNGI